MRSLLLLMLAVYVPNVTSTTCNIARDQVDPNYTFLKCEVESSGDLTVNNQIIQANAQKEVKLEARGSFKELKSTEIAWVKWLCIKSKLLTTFNLNNYHGLPHHTNLKKVEILGSAQNLTILVVSLHLSLDWLIINDAQRIHFDCYSFKKSKLKNLHIENAQHVDLDFACLPLEMEWLELVNCSLQNGDLINMDRFQHHQQLVNFELSGNKDLTSLDIATLPTSIETLNLNDNGLTSLDIATLPTSIETLNLNNNNLKLNLSSLPKLVNMKDLYLAGNTDLDGKSLHEYHSDAQHSVSEFVRTSYVTTTTAPATVATAAPATTTTPATVAPATTTASTTSSTKRSTANDNEDKQPEGDGGEDEESEGGDAADEQPKGGDVADEQPEGGDAADKKPEGGDAADKKPEGDGGEDEDGSSSNHVTMPLIIVICVRFIATLL